MRDVVIIGGGLTGLAAAWELEQQGIGYTLIEVKGWFGGSLNTVREAGFTVDTGASLLEAGDWSCLSELGLTDALIPVQTPHGERWMFRDGTRSLVDALAARLTQPTMTRMAVSSVGRLDHGRFGVCLENGLMINARALIITAPARYAEHMLRSLQPEIAYRLLDYQYDSITQVTLGYQRADLDSLPDAPPDDYAFTSWLWTDHPARMPAGGVLLQAGLRNRVVDEVEPTLALQVAALMRWPLNPLVARADYWALAHPLTIHQPGHLANMDAIDHLLLPGVTLAGSDYRALRLDERIAQGRDAARRAVLQSGKV